MNLTFFLFLYDPVRRRFYGFVVGVAQRNSIMKQEFVRYTAIATVTLLVLLADAASASSPEVPNLPQSVRLAPHLSLSYRTIQAAGASTDFLTKGKNLVTFFAPSDASCANIAQLKRGNIDSSWAKSFVLNHTVHGQVNVMRVGAQHDELKLNVVSGEGQGQAISIREGGSLQVKNFQGNYIKISIKSGVVLLGKDAHIRPDSFFVSSTGSVGIVDLCSEL